MGNTFFTSDLHFGHKNIIEFCDRPWSSLEDMREGLIQRWNEVIRNQDEVYVLGDFSFLNAEKTMAILRRLNGQKFLVAGNHDHGRKKWVGGRCFQWARYKHEKAFTCADGTKQRIVMSHYPFRTWAGDSRGAWGLHGHCHSTNPIASMVGRSLDVGVDGHDWRPWALEEIKKIMDKVPYAEYRHAKADAERGD